MMQGLGELGQTGLIGNGDQRTLDGNQIGHRGGENSRERQTMKENSSIRPRPAPTVAVGSLHFSDPEPPAHQWRSLVSRRPAPTTSRPSAPPPSRVGRTTGSGAIPPSVEP